MTPIIRHFGLTPYRPIWQAMQQFTDERNNETVDEIWCLEHEAVFTLGQAGCREHILDAGNIDVVSCDRGGQVTYHGPGQLVVYPLINLQRYGLGIRQWVELLQACIIHTLSRYQIIGEQRPAAPGVYVNHNKQQSKIASLGLRVRRGCSYHGLALNVDMDLDPFLRINPCGIKDLTVTDMAHLNSAVLIPQVANNLIDELIAQLTVRTQLTTTQTLAIASG